VRRLDDDAQVRERYYPESAELIKVARGAPRESIEVRSLAIFR
jgi:hypothetical protein